MDLPCHHPVAPLRLGPVERCIGGEQQRVQVGVAAQRGAVHQADADRGVLLGFLSVRHELNEFLLEEGGHVGYSVRPSARRRGLALTPPSAVSEQTGSGITGRVDGHDLSAGGSRYVAARSKAPATGLRRSSRIT